MFKKYCVVSFLIFFGSGLTGYTQSGVASGILENEGIAIPGVNVIVKGTSTSTQTDFDGNYSIACQIGDVLVFSFIGMTTKEIHVTPEMFEDQIVKQRTEPVQKIVSSDYAKALKTIIDSLGQKARLSSNTLTYNRLRGNFDYGRIKDFKKEEQKIKITYLKPDVYFQIRFNSSLSLQFVGKKKLPKTQNNYAQGRPLNGVSQWFGADTNEIFSFGPLLNSLAFDSSNYIYDTNGRLINRNLENQIAPYKNELFKPSTLSSNNLNLIVFYGKHSVDLNMRNNIQENMFNKEKSKLTQFDVNYDFNKKASFFFKTTSEINNQPNQNGFINNVLLSNYVTPSTFENKQGYVLTNNMQRSFSPNWFNNPFWLIDRTENKNRSTAFIAGVKGEHSFNSHLQFKSILSYTREKEKLNFALPVHTAGFENGYLSEKRFSKNTFYVYLRGGYNHTIVNFAEMKYKSSIHYKNEALIYDLLEQDDFVGSNFNNPTNEVLNSRKLNNNIVRLGNEIKFDFEMGFDGDITIGNNSVSSYFQGEEFFLPFAKTYINMIDVIGYRHWINKFSVAIGIAKEAKEMSLYYNNQSHNSLTIDPRESRSFTANNDIFNSRELAFETATNFDIEGSIVLFDNKVDIGVNYYSSKTNNGIFPVLTDQSFVLNNVASIKNQGIEASIAIRAGRYWNNFLYKPTFLFSKNKAEVLDLSGGRSSIPIAGFNNVSKNLIVGEQTGAIVGSAFLRNTNGSIIIDTDGYPMVNPQNKIIGNTTPDFNLSWSNNFKIGKFNLDFLIDYQHGGDVWNGTKNVLNYLGKSEESGDLRTTTNFVFDGVDQLGNINTIPVDFANPSQDVALNRWVRYGFDGVDEEAIVDATFVNLKSVRVSYDFADDDNHTFFEQLELSLFANNLFYYTKEKGVSPYSSLFDHASGKGLDYFNRPLLKEIGFKINIKI